MVGRIISEIPNSVLRKNGGNLAVFESKAYNVLRQEPVIFVKSITSMIRYEIEL